MASELASVVQSAHIEHNPDPDRDINPSTAASAKIPATISIAEGHHEHDPLSDLDSQSSASTIPSEVLRPQPRQRRAPGHLPLPDLRFEQTYLASLKNCETTGAVIYVTVRDQVLLPLVQGIGYHLLISGWRFMNRGSKFAGEGIGARVRKWWWGVNGWTMPKDARRTRGEGIREWTTAQFGSGLGD